VVVVKSLGADDGQEAYTMAATDGLSTTVEALGMAHLLAAKLTDVLMGEDG
jgi:hypothetical protein